MLVYFALGVFFVIGFTAFPFVSVNNSHQIKNTLHWLPERQQGELVQDCSSV